MAYPRRVVILLTQISQGGGIETFNKHFLGEVLDIWSNVEFRVISLHDVNIPDIKINPMVHIAWRICGAKARWVRIVKYITAVINTLITVRPDIIIACHINLLKPFWFLLPILRIPYSIVVYGIEVWNMNFLSKSVLYNAQFVISVSQYTATHVLRQVNNSLPVAIIYPPVETERFCIRNIPTNFKDEYGIKGYPILLTVARYASTERYKGYDTVIQALPLLRLHFPKIQYLLVGLGDDIPRIRNMVSELGVQQHVIFCGYVPSEILPYYYNACDIFIMPSKWEGFGIVYLEAMASGKPVIVGNSCGAPEVINNGEYGLLVDYGDTNAIVKAVSQILNKETDEQMRNPHLLRAFVVKKYGKDAFRHRVEKLLEQISRTNK